MSVSTVSLIPDRPHHSVRRDYPGAPAEVRDAFVAVAALEAFFMTRARTCYPWMTCPGHRPRWADGPLTTRYCPLRTVERDGGAVPSAGRAPRPR
jgi:hypothetical protein